MKSESQGGLGRKLDSRDRHREGAVLAAALILVMLLGILAVAILQINDHVGMEAADEVNDANAFWAAEAGIEHAKVLGQKGRKPFSQISYRSGTLWGTNVLTGTTSKGGYTVSIADDPGWVNANHALKKYVITSVGTTATGSRRIITVKAWLTNFAGYMHASQQENGVYFLDGDRIDGPVYTNDRLNIQNPSGGGPVFLQLVSSAMPASSTNPNYSGTTPSATQFNAIFTAGLALNATPLDISGQFSSDHIADIKSESGNGGLRLDGAAATNYSFVFLSNGKFTYQKGVATNSPVVTNSLAALTNGLIYVDGDVYVRGAVNGNVTLAAEHSIYITSNLVYVSALPPNNPFVNTNTFSILSVTNMLGLMAKTNVIVLGTNTVEIHASVMTTTGGVNAEKCYTDIGGKYIRLYGSVSQYSRGVVSRNSSPFQGFHKDYKFDTRFGTEAPPWFPASVYVFTGWSQAGGN